MEQVTDGRGNEQRSQSRVVPVGVREAEPHTGLVACGSRLTGTRAGEGWH